MFNKLTQIYMRNKRAKERRADVRILWPILVSMCEGDFTEAKRAFGSHIFDNESWTKDLSYIQLANFLHDLGPYDREAP